MPWDPKKIDTKGMKRVTRALIENANECSQRGAEETD